MRILGHEYKLKAEIVVLNGLSSHADHADLLRSLGPLAASTKQVRLVHGEPARAEILATALRGIGFADVAIPESGDTAYLREARILPPEPSPLPFLPTIPKA